MRYAAKKTGLINVFIWGVVAILIAAVIVTPTEQKLIVAIIMLPVLAFILSIYFNTYYEFREVYLYARSGPFSEKIFYENIYAVRLCKNYLSSMALSRERIEIKHGKYYITGTTLISPVNREKFYERLIARCPNIEGINDEELTIKN